MRRSSWDWTLMTFLEGNSNSTMGTRADFRWVRKPTSEGWRKRRERPVVLERAVRPTRWM